MKNWSEEQKGDLISTSDCPNDINYTLRRSDESFAKQTLQWTPQRHRRKSRQKNTWKQIQKRKCVKQARKDGAATRDRPGYTQDVHYFN